MKSVVFLEEKCGILCFFIKLHTFFKVIIVFLYKFAM